MFLTSARPGSATCSSILDTARSAGPWVAALAVRLPISCQAVHRKWISHSPVCRAASTIVPHQHVPSKPDNCFAPFAVNLIIGWARGFVSTRLMLLRDPHLHLGNLFIESDACRKLGPL